MLGLLTAAAPFLLLRRGSHYLPTLRRRLGGHPRVERRPRLWLHAVSVGEVGVASTLIRALPPATSVVLTTVTPTGQAVARRSVCAAAADVTYLPFDLGLPVRRFLDAYTPRALVLVEGDLWPLLLERAKRRALPVVVVNGRVSDRGFARLRRLGRWVRPVLGPVDLYGVQTERDRERLVELGVAPEKVRVTGNLKFESPEPAALPELEAEVRRLAAGRPVLIAGSTMHGEEPAVLDAFVRVGAARALLVLAPRHPERSIEVEELLAERALPAVRRSRIDAPAAGPTRSGARGSATAPIGSESSVDSAATPGAGARPAVPAGGAGAPAVVLLDTMGELASLYRLAAGVFVGGTLVATGGHNPLEAARFAVPIAAGPSMENFAEIAAMLDARNAWRRVRDAGELAAAWTSWLDDPASARALGERGATLLAESRGALERTLDLLRPLLGAPDR
ncbi:MAG TPA: 3-deoxy-D-manno-octulosonic acid transferase [Thermoanaerobaculia bacterium]|nr:3-deoxy-D-manno-octulosonic acid transferase [Thermoanaerobaculia bacterium]